MGKQRPIPDTLRQTGEIENRRIRIRVSLLLLRENSIYLIKNFIDKREVWFLPGGSVNWGETMLDAANREGNEELGIDMKTKRFVALFDIISPNKDFHSIEAVFSVELSEDQIITPKESFEKNEVTENKYAISGEWVLLDKLSNIEVYPKNFVTKFLPQFLKEGNMQGDYLGNDWN